MDPSLFLEKSDSKYFFCTLFEKPISVFESDLRSATSCIGHGTIF